MTNLFQPNLVAYGDLGGVGVYEVGHFLQHQQYIQKLIAQGVTTFPDWDILHMNTIDANEFLSWLNVHEAVHELLRGYSNVSGVNLSNLDRSSPEEWEIWQQAHRQEHAAFDLHFGTT